MQKIGYGEGSGHTDAQTAGRSKVVRPKAARLGWLLVGWLILAASPLSAQERITYRDRTGNQEITIAIQEEHQSQGFV
ncbi:MAG TPA: hypothetical protein VFH83_14020, partial [Spirochaetia bacterium]|nr:hypothetical protein [Spirochaetia bacterium]